MWIREEIATDHEAIRRVIEAAFAGAEHASGTESRIVDALRDAGSLSVSLVAGIDSRITGHVAFSPVALDGGPSGWHGLGPVAVDPSEQRRGVGSALIRAGLDRLSALRAKGCVVLGDPAYYTRFGFRQRTTLHYPGAPAAYFMALALEGEPPDATVAYHSAFSSA